MSSALATALRRAAQLQSRRTRNVVVPAEPVRAGLARRAAADAPLTLRPITVLRPLPETPQDMREFVELEFREANQKRDRTR